MIVKIEIIVTIMPSQEGNMNHSTIDMEDGGIYKAMLENMDVGVYFVDKSRQITFWNKGAETISGFSKEEVVGKFCHHDILSHVDEKGNKVCVVGCPLKDTTEDGIPRETVVYLHHKEGHRVRVKVKSFPLYIDNKLVGAGEVFEKLIGNEINKEFRDSCTEMSCSIEELKMLALYDKLTDLPNRRYLESILESRFMEYKHLHLTFGILFMDIDDFRNFNNTYGHDMGDKVLKVVANTFISAIRKTDFVGRWGGEEFIGVFPMVSKIELEAIAEKIRVLTENSVLKESDGSRYNITVSIGGTIINAWDDIESLIKRADEKMYISKQLGKNRVTIG